MNAVIYARYSSYSQTEQSIEGQIRDCREFAERENLKIVGEYVDRALTGTNDNRPEFRRMIKDSARREFDFVIVWKIDRFARNRIDAAINKNRLRQNGVKVLYAKENIGAGTTAIILESLLEGMAEAYSLDLSEKVKRGLRESIAKGTFTGGRPPFGYRIDKNLKLVPDEKNAPIIRFVFNSYASGKSKKEIIAELNRKGFRNSSGNPFTINNFQNALRNKKYIGIYEYGDVVVPGVIPEPLIEEETFSLVQKRLDEVRRAPASAKARIAYLLQSKAFCGHCGAPLVGESGRGKSGTVYHYYACANKKKNHACSKKNEKKDFLETYVVEQTVEYILHSEQIRFIAAEIVKTFHNGEIEDKIKTLENQRRKIDREIENIVDTLSDTDSKSIRTRLAERIELLEVQKADLENDLRKIQAEIKMRLTEEELIQWLESFRGGDICDPGYAARMIDTFLNSIYLYDHKIVLYYNLENSEQVNYIEMLSDTGELEDLEPVDDEDNAGDVRISNTSLRFFISNPNINYIFTVHSFGIIIKRD